MQKSWLYTIGGIILAAMLATASSAGPACGRRTNCAVKRHTGTRRYFAPRVYPHGGNTGRDKGKRKCAGRSMEMDLRKLCGLGIVVLNVTYAASAGADVATVEVGNDACGSWVSKRRIGAIRNAQLEAWATGLREGSLQGGRDGGTIFGWLGNYCMVAHPFTGLPDALVELAREREVQVQWIFVSALSE
jgi:hypothetical protein